MDILILLLAIMGSVYGLFLGGAVMKRVAKPNPEPPCPDEEPVPWNSFRHTVSDVEGRFVVEKAFKTKRNHFAMRLKNLQTGEVRTVYGHDEDEVSFKARRVFGHWIVSC